MRRAWATLLLALLLGGLVLGLAGSTETDNDPASSLPSSAESTKVAQLQKELPSGRTNPALIVVAKGGQPLSDADLATVQALGRPILSDDRKAALITVPLASTGDSAATIDAVRDLREKASTGLPPGVTAQVTGGAGFSADLADSFSGANTKLLLVTVVVVTVLLLITYRSPILWIVPLFVVGFADQLAAKVVALLSQHTDLAVNGSTTGIVTVLVFGAGTDYALLLISRYREELHRYENRFEAMGKALRGAGPAIAASAGTVILALLTLVLATLRSNTALGLTSAAGVAIAAVFALVVLPAALVVCGRGLFWPFIPRVGESGPEDGKGMWARVGRAVVRRPVAVTVVSAVVLGLLSLGGLGTRVGLSQTEQFRVEAESVQGLETLSKYFPAGAAGPAVVLTTPDQAARVLETVSGTPGVAQARIAEETPARVSISAVLEAAPDTAEAFRTIRDLRGNLDGEALVGGTVATAMDTRDAARRDLIVIVPVILAVVFLVLVALLRALVAPILLMITVVVSFLASLGAGSWLFRNVFDYPALDNAVPLFSFLFLVALGVDYNIFLVTRAKEEAATRGTRDGMVHALAVTGAVITSAGILLAAVFAVLGVLPVVTLTQIGVIVGIGVLLDTLLVRTVLVPALATLTGDRFWWPGRPAAVAAGAVPAPSRPHTDWDAVNRAKLAETADGPKG
ncbi:RND superfamily putative drug exporter [Actinoplanes campanulatus]|uniref:RND superfamily putative drug exporter n=1 Tax=Actinoplanes campanulatus TaxID=113559 RepID=A0A7W5AI48_9ACTN|nr:MMPL family transporter [Actinoplanes campanulatus]MBB3096718.1 RND superfamily putative drug exporter [Actinoplanes campanulatus]GGN30827.1 membrane protein [Actinoplanes campanulatus]GID37261.1 membrane protein [Actinoplanes campanulatus]